MRNKKLIELIKSNPKTNLLPTDDYKRLISNVIGCLWAAKTDEEIQILLFCTKEIEDWGLEDRIKYFSATPITGVVNKQENLKQEIIDRLEWYDSHTWGEYEIWIDPKLQTLYRVPVDIKHYWDNAEVLDETIKINK